MRYPTAFYKCKSISNPSERLKALEDLLLKTNFQIDTGVHHWLSGDSTKYMRQYKNRIEREISQAKAAIEIIKQESFRYGG